MVLKTVPKANVCVLQQLAFPLSVLMSCRQFPRHRGPAAGFLFFLDFMGSVFAALKEKYHHFNACMTDATETTPFTVLLKTGVHEQAETTCATFFDELFDASGRPRQITCTARKRNGETLLCNNISKWRTDPPSQHYKEAGAVAGAAAPFLLLHDAYGLVGPVDSRLGQLAQLVQLVQLTHPKINFNVQKITGPFCQRNPKFLDLDESYDTLYLAHRNLPDSDPAQPHSVLLHPEKHPTSEKASDQNDLSQASSLPLSPLANHYSCSHAAKSF